MIPAVRALTEHVRAFVESSNPGPLLHPDGVNEAQQVADMLRGQPGTDPHDEAKIVLAWWHWCRYQILPEGDDHAELVAALELFSALLTTRPDAVPEEARQALTEAIAESSDAVDPLLEEARELLDEYGRTQQVATINTALDLLSRSLRTAAQNDPRRTVVLSELAGGMKARFDHLGAEQDIDAAVKLGRQAVAASALRDPGRSGRLSNLGTALLDRYRHFARSDDLEDAVKTSQSAIDSASPDHPDRAGLLSNLAGALSARFTSREKEADLHAAVAASQEAVDVTAPGHPSRAGLLSNLALKLWLRFDRFGRSIDLDAAISASEEAVQQTPASDSRRARYLATLAVARHARFERFGDSAALDDAVGALREAVGAIPLDQPDHSRYLAILGATLRVRYDSDGQEDDLDDAIAAIRQALVMVPQSQPEHARLRSSLAGALLARYQRTGQPEDVAERDLQAALAAAHDAVATASTDDNSRAGYLSNLGHVMLATYRRTERPDDLNAAIQAYFDAQATISSDDPDRAGILSDLAASLFARYERAGIPDDLNAAAKYGRRAVEATPADHPDRARYLSNLGTVLRALFHRLGAPSSLAEAVGSYRKAATMPTAPAAVRMTAARGWGLAAEEAEDATAAADAFAAAVGLLPEVAWPGLDRRTREEQLSEWSGLAAEAAAFAVAAGQRHRAVELLEHGRSVLWTQLLRLRTDLTGLAEQVPDLAANLDLVRRQLDRPTSSLAAAGAGPDDPMILADGAAASHRIERRRELARIWDDLVMQVHQVKGFENFLQPKPFSELQRAASGGPVVMVNASPAGCHALILNGVSETDAVVVELPALTYDEAVDRANALLDMLPGADDRGWHPFEPDWEPRNLTSRQQSPFDILEWLWDVIAHPVMEALGFSGPLGAEEQRPRVWWCPIGPLTALPLHAAGRYGRTADKTTFPGDTVPGRVISSYTSTLTALLQARRPAARDVARQLVVGMAETPGHYPLPAVSLEVEVLARYFPPPVHAYPLVGPAATARAVLDALPGYPWIHLACHGLQHSTDPSRSAFALFDGPLSVADLAGARMETAELAFLSACQTAAGGNQLLDESIHLAATVQLLGYRHVIATLWTIADSPAPQLAESVYGVLAGTGNPDPADAAAALHHAVQVLREAYPDQPLLWASYIHIGP